MNRVPIPRAFYLFGERIEVKQDHRLSDNHEHIGQSRYRDSQIVLQAQNDGFVRTEPYMEQTFLHELVHWILRRIEEHKLCDNEKFVELFSRALHQVLTTAEYDE